MDVFNHFSCYTNLPIRLADVADHVLETSVVQEIRVYAVDMDPSYCLGFCWIYQDRSDPARPKTVAVIGYSRELTPEMRRIVICKELIHLLDNHLETAQTRARVEQLLEQIVLPPGVLEALPASSDRRGILLAMAVLMPRDTIEEFRPKVDAGSVSIATIAKAAALPESWVRVCFSPLWQEALQAIAQTWPAAANIAQPVQSRLSFPTPSDAPEPDAAS